SSGYVGWQPERESLGNWERAGGSEGTIFFSRRPGFDVFFLFQKAANEMGRLDGASAQARLEHADILRDDPPRSLRTPPSPRRRCPASDIHYSARSSDGLVAATVPARSSAWAICSATSS